jgi:hypothetical protein
MILEVFHRHQEQNLNITWKGKVYFISTYSNLKHMLILRITGFF